MNKVILWMVLIVSPLLYETPFVTMVILLEIVLLFIGFSSSRKHRVDKLLKFAFAFYTLWSIIIYITLDTDLEGLIRLLQFSGCVFSFLVAYNLNWTESDIKSTIIALKTIIYIMFIYWLTSSHELSGFSFIYNNSDTFGSLLLMWFMYLFLFDSYKSPALWLCFILLYFTGSRSAFFSSIILMLLMFLSNKLVFKHSNVLFLTTVALLASFVVIYPTLMVYDFGADLNTFSQEHLNKNLMSGRDVIWLELFGKIKESPFIGYGLGTTPNIVGIKLSSHNVFLQTALQSGLIGMALFVFLLYSIFTTNKYIDDKRTKSFMISTIIVIMLHECFEICLTQNALTIGLMMWLTMGLPTNKKIEGLVRIKK